MFKSWLENNESQIFEFNVINFLKEKLKIKNKSKESEKILRDLYAKAIQSPDIERKKILHRIDINVADLEDIINRIAKFMKLFGGDGDSLKNNLTSDLNSLKNKIISSLWDTYNLKNKEAS